MMHSCIQKCRDFQPQSHPTYSISASNFHFALSSLSTRLHSIGHISSLDRSEDTNNAPIISHSLPGIFLNFETASALYLERVPALLLE